MFIDSHAHLEGKRYYADREQVLARAKQNGIEAYLAIGNGDGPETADCGIRLAENTTGNRNIRESGRAWEFILMKQTSRTQPLIPKCCNGRGIPR